MTSAGTQPLSNDGFYAKLVAGDLTHVEAVDRTGDCVTQRLIPKRLFRRNLFARELASPNLAIRSHTV